MQGTRVLIIEDEQKVADAVREGLEQQGFEARTVRTGEEGLRLLDGARFDVVILDLQLPGRDGIEVLEKLRRGADPVPVVVVTARDTVTDRIAGLDAGADDYLVKPFALAELLARVRAVLRRGGPEHIGRMRLADLEMDLIRRSVVRGGKEVTLTTREFELLEYLLRHKGFNVTREMLALDVWKEPMRATSLNNVIDVHIAKLRKKVDEGVSPKLIHTVRGVGFILSETDG